jgi:hypothetical protein
MSGHIQTTWSAREPGRIEIVTTFESQLLGQLALVPPPDPEEFHAQHSQVLEIPTRSGPDLYGRSFGTERQG